MKERAAELERQNDSITQDNHALTRENGALRRKNDTLAQKLEESGRELKQLRRENDALRHNTIVLESEGLSVHGDRDEPTEISTTPSDLVCYEQAYGQGHDEDPFPPSTKSVAHLPTLEEELGHLLDGSGSESGWACPESVAPSLEETHVSTIRPSADAETDDMGRSPASPRQRYRCDDAHNVPSDQSLPTLSKDTSAVPVRKRLKQRDHVASHHTDISYRSGRGAASPRIDLNSLHGHAGQGKLFTIIAIVNKAKKGNDRYLLTDEGRCGTSWVEAVLHQSKKRSPPRVSAGDGIVLRHVAVRYNDSKIPYIRSIKKSTWCIWSPNSESTCSDTDCCTVFDEKSRMLELLAWCSEDFEK